MLLELFQNNSDDNLNSFGLLFLKEVFNISRDTDYFKKKEHWKVSEPGFRLKPSAFVNKKVRYLLQKSKYLAFSKKLPKLCLSCLSN